MATAAKRAARGSGELPRLHHPHKNGQGQPALRVAVRAEANDRQQLVNAAKLTVLERG
jgi:hypothetical protein